MNKKFPYKLFGSAIAVLIALAFVLPTVLDLKTMKTEDQPWFASLLPETQLKMGLDLQGGIQMVLGVDVDKAVENEAERYVEDLKVALKEADIDYQKVSQLNQTDVNVQLVDIEKKPDLLRFVQQKFNVIELTDQNDSTLEFHFKIIEQRRKEIERDTIRQALETIRNRIDEFGVNEPQIATQGRNRIVVQLPGLDDPARARELLGKTAQLEFKIVDETFKDAELFRMVDRAKKELKESKPTGDITPEMINNKLAGQLPEGTEILFGEEKDSTSNQTVTTPYLVGKVAMITGEKLDDARVSFGGEFNQPFVSLTFNPTGARLFEKITRENVKKRLAIVLDNKVNSAPVINEPIPNGRAQITLGGLKDAATLRKEARDLVIVLRAGALPAPVDVLENRSVGPSLGNDSIEMGKTSLLIGALFVVIFMLLWYRTAGVVADIVLGINLLFILAVLAAFQATLTLPGIAGLVLTVGMAVDANIIIFERIREELAVGKSMLQAVDAGFSRAHLTILDANVTTIIAGFVLLQYGSGPVKGFAVTLIVGVLTSYITALWIARFIFSAMLDRQVLTGGLFKPKRRAA